MIQPLRTAHRRAFVTLAFVLPAVLLVGLGARRPRPLANATVTQLPGPMHLVSKSGILWQKHSMHTEFYGDSTRPQNVYVVLRAEHELNEPDLLVYWSANEPKGNALPGDAQLVGAFTNSNALLLPLDEKRSGHLVLFSLAHQNVFDTAAVERLP